MPGTPADFHPCFYIEHDGEGYFDHDWKQCQDTIGDCEVINGTYRIYWSECRRCGQEEQSDCAPPHDDGDDYGYGFY